MHNCRMEMDCDEGMDVSTGVQAQVLDLADSVLSCGMVRAGSLREDNHRQKVSSNPYRTKD